MPIEPNTVALLLLNGQLCLILQNVTAVYSVRYLSWPAGEDWM
jgi:hypothetical protein